MASQVTVVKRLEKCTVTLETAYGTAPDVGDRFVSRFDDQGLDIKLMQTQIKVEDTDTRLHAKRKNIHGLKSWEASGKFNMRCEGGMLIAAATPARSWHTDLLKVAFGGESMQPGSTVASSASGTAITVASGHGSRFPQGTWHAILHEGVKYPFKVINQVSDVLTIWPALPEAATAADVIYGGYNNWPTDTNTETLFVTAAKKQSSALQYLLSCGSVTELGITLGRDALLAATLKMVGKTWEGPSAQGLDTDPSADTMAPPLDGGTATFLLQPIDVTTREVNPIRDSQYKMDVALKYLEDFSGVHQQTSGVVNIRDREFANATVKSRFNPDFETWYEAKTSLAFVLIVSEIDVDTPANTRFEILELPTCFVADKPIEGDDAGLSVHTLQLSAMMSEMNASTTAGTAAAPVVYARI